MSKEKLKRCSLLLTEKQIQYLKAKRRMSVYVRALLEREMENEVNQFQLSPCENALIMAMIAYCEERDDMNEEAYLEREDKDYVDFKKPQRYSHFGLDEYNLKEFVQWLNNKQKKEEAQLLETLNNEDVQRILGFAERKWKSNYPENWKTKYGELTLGGLIDEFEIKRMRGIREFRMSDILEATGVSYGVAYYKLKPILQNLGFDFVDSRRKA